jgi:uncharacterized protein YgbK (DUF1537 family)
VIAIIADDLTGAAELAGIAFASGLRAAVMTEMTRLEDVSGIDVVAIDTDTRSRPAAEAAAAVARITSQVLQARPDWIYKKTDSVLRGQVVAEIEAMLTAATRDRCLLVPANPSRGRVVRGGELWLEGRRLHETDFAHDPEHPRLTSRVRDLLQPASDRIELPDVESEEDLRRVVRRATEDDARELWAGAADFFKALLERLVPAAHRPAIETGAQPAPQRVVLISGSRAAWRARSEGACDDTLPTDVNRKCARTAMPIRVMPDALTLRNVSEQAVGTWARELADLMASTPRVLVAIGSAPFASAPAPVLARRLARSAVQAIRRAGTIDRVLAEGGATAAAVASTFGWSRLDVVAQPAPGVVALEPRPGGGPQFVVKVGSYDWPAAVWGVA